MNYSAARTPELGSDLTQITELFNRVFDKQESVERLQHKYQSPPHGYSFHGLMKDDDSHVVGAMTVIPYEFIYFGQERTFGCFVDLMIDPQARGDMFAFKKIYDAVMDLIGDEIDLVYAVPNDNSYLYFKKFLKWHDIGDLFYYVMPVRIGSLKPGLKLLDPLTRFLSRLHAQIPGIASSKPVVPGISKLNSDRFQTWRFANDYQMETVKGTKIYYRVFQEDSSKICYVGDVDPLSARTLDVAISRIRRTVDCDAIMYIDSAKMNPHKAIRLPRSYEPRNLHLVAKTVTERLDDRVLGIENWQFNLSDFDAR